MARPRRESGIVFLRKDSAFWWINYRNREGRRVQESTATTDRQEAERFLRKRLDATDDGSLSIFRRVSIALRHSHTEFTDLCFVAVC